jgi:hypothetical protein
MEDSRHTSELKNERIALHVIHWGVVLVCVLGVIALRFHNDLDNASTTALLGTVLGHAGTAASYRGGTRFSDKGNGNQ